MTTYKKLDISSWSRRNQFYYFKDFDSPFFNVCSEVDVTELHRFVKERGLSFFVASLFASLKAANEREEFRYRLKGDEVIIYDVIHGGSTVLSESDGDAFGFCYFDFDEHFHRFNADAEQALAENARSEERFDPRADRDDLIHYSVIPWISFFSITHPRRFNTPDSIPKIIFGKYDRKGARLMMPISIDVHHSLMDGFHVGNYLRHLQEILTSPGKHLTP